MMHQLQGCSKLDQIPNLVQAADVCVFLRSKGAEWPAPVFKFNTIHCDAMIMPFYLRREMAAGTAQTQHPISSIRG